MSAFWKYFHDRLNWLPIFRPGPVSALIKGLALHLDESRKDILWLRQQWNPATCNISLLAEYGASRGIARNRFDTDESYRKRVVYAYAWHKLGGKVRGLETILAESGFRAAVENSDDALLWAHFKVLVDLNNSFYGKDESSFLWFLINEYKPARSIIELVRTKSTHPLRLIIAAANIDKTVTQAFTWRWQQTFTSLPVFAGVGLFAATKSFFSIPNRVPEPVVRFNPRVAVSGLTTTRIGV